MGDNDGGVLFIGDKGKIMCGCYGSSPRIIPRDLMKEVGKPKKVIERIPRGKDGHEADWIRACKEGSAGKPASSNFDYSGPLTETVVMGNLATRTGKFLEWDGEGMKVTNVDEANQYVFRKYRDGWSL